MANTKIEAPAANPPPRSTVDSTVVLDASALAHESLEFGVVETPPPPPQLPANFGRYRINSILARGGMGIIYHCTDPDYDRDVALKALLQEHAAKPEFLRRFHAEVQITSHLEHPGIVPVYEKGWLDDGRPFFTMRKVNGEALDKLIATAER